MKKKKHNFIITIVPSDEPEHIKEKNYNDLKIFIVNILKNIDKYKDNKVPV